MPLDRCLAAYGVNAVERLEVEEIGIVDDARDDLAHVVGLAVIDGDHPAQLVGAVAWLAEGPVRRRRQSIVPMQLRHHLAAQADAVGIVLGHVVGDAGDGRVHLLAGGGAQQRRPGQEHLGPPLHHDDVVGEAGEVGAARRRRAVHDRDLRDARRRETRLVAEGLAALDEDLRLVIEVGAAGLDELDQRQLVLARDFLAAQLLLEPHRRGGAALDGAIRGGDEAAYARDIADAVDDAAAEHILRAVIVVHAKSGEGRQLEERAAAVEQQRDALARQELAALGELALLGVRGLAHLLLERAERLDQREHRRAVGAEALARGVDAAVDRRHGQEPRFSRRKNSGGDSSGKP